jgi:hypothetical protein
MRSTCPVTRTLLSALHHLATKSFCLRSPRHARPLITRHLSLLSAGLLCGVACSHAQTPSVTSVSPLALRPGATTEFTLSGQNLSGPTAIWMTFPTLNLNPTFDRDTASSTQVACRVEVPKDAPVGIGAFRLATTNGISPLRLFMIDDLTTVPRNADTPVRAANGGSGARTGVSALRLHHDPASRITHHTSLLKWPAAIDDAADELNFDYFKFTTRKGQRLSIEVVAQRLGSRLDPVLRVLDQKGREVAYCDDDPRVGKDSRLTFTAPTTGDYIIEVRDINYGGGPGFHYRLRVGDFPLTAMAYPPFQQPDTTTTVKILAPLLDVETKMPLDTPRISVPVRASHPDRNRNRNLNLPPYLVTRHSSLATSQATSFVSVYPTSRPQFLEQEPNNTTNTATPFLIPSGMSARFEQTNDVDVFRFPASKGQQLVFRARNRSLGSPCDLFMSIQDVKGATIAEFDPMAPDEGTITNTFKEAGQFFLTIQELNQTGGPDLGYHVDAYELRPGFELSVQTNDFQSRPGETVTIKVTAVRRDYDGPIALSIEGPASFTAEPITIPDKKNEADLKIKLSDELAAGEFAHLRIVAKAKIGEREETITASTLPALRKLWPNLPHPPPELDGLVAIGVRGSQSTPPAEKPKEDERE